MTTAGTLRATRSVGRLRTLGAFQEILPLPNLEDRAAWVKSTPGDPEVLEVPRGADTSYLTHALFRYVGKLPPPLVAYLLARYSKPGDLIIDPMCGGGTTAIEAVSSGRRSMNCDINPIALLLTEALSAPADIDSMLEFAATVATSARPVLPPGDLAKFFSADTYGLIVMGLDAATTPANKALIYSIVRRASFADTKKINTVVDPTKIPKPARALLSEWTHRFVTAFGELGSLNLAGSVTTRAKADEIPVLDGEADLVFLHPPYLTNTAFSEVTHLQLTLMGLNPVDVRKNELAYRGSYFHVPNGLQKYLLGWTAILRTAARVTKAGGHVVTVIGDGSIEGVRIPVAAITEEFAADAGLTLVQRATHVLNNQTGWTLSRKMLAQHVRVFQKV